jgi:hypothetical protein
MLSIGARLSRGWMGCSWERKLELGKRELFICLVGELERGRNRPELACCSGRWDH